MAAVAVEAAGCCGNKAWSTGMAAATPPRPAGKVAATAEDGARLRLAGTEKDTSAISLATTDFLHLYRNNAQSAPGFVSLVMGVM